MKQRNNEYIEFDNLGLVRKTEKVSFLDPRGIVLYYEAWLVKELIDEGGITEMHVC